MLKQDKQMGGVGGAATQAAKGQVAYSIAAYNGDFGCLSWNAKPLKSCGESGVIWFLHYSVEDKGARAEQSPLRDFALIL